MLKPAAFLDRDNTLIANDGDLGDPDEVRLLQGAASAVASLKGLGFTVVVVTNQGGVARGKYTEDDVRAVHDRLLQLVSDSANGATIDAFYYCPFHPKGSVPEYTREDETRKPAPGMLMQAAEDLGLDLHRSWMVGDQMRDIQAGHAAGTRNILLRGDAARLTPLDIAKTPGVQVDRADGDLVVPDFLAASLVEAVRLIAQHRYDRDDVSNPKSTLPGNAPGQGGDDPSMMLRGGPGEPDAGAQTPMAAKPFRPWGAVQAVQEAPIAEPKIRQVWRGITKDKDASESGPTATSEPSSPPAPATPAPLAEPTIPEPIRLAKQAKQAKEAQAVPTAAPSPAPEPAAAVSEPVKPRPRRNRAHREAPAQPAEERAGEPATVGADASSAGQARLLRMILQELRHQRGTRGDFAASRVIALLLTALAGFSVVAGLWMGQADDGLLFRWVAVAVVLQLMGATAVLWGRSS